MGLPGRSLQFDPLALSLWINIGLALVVQQSSSIWPRIFTEAGEKSDKTFRIAELARGLIEDAGFENIVEKKYNLLVGCWSSDPCMRKIGKCNLLKVHHDAALSGDRWPISEFVSGNTKKSKSFLLR
jgi:hypothetical protein